MKVMIVLGTRPEIIRLSIIIPKLDKYCKLILIHSGQNYDENLNDIFFDQMQIRKPDHYLNIRGTFGKQVVELLSHIEVLITDYKPDKFLILGDTNSALSAIVAKRYGIPVYHMEAGNRCYDDRVPEEVNRRIIDHSSDILMPYTERSRKNLIKEGIEGERIFVTGNPIFEVIKNYHKYIQQSNILNQLQLKPQQYFLVTLHRAENVDLDDRLRSFLSAFEKLHQQYQLPIIISVHPHTRSRMEKCCITEHHPQIHFLKPFGLFDFITLEQNALAVLSDSGTVQEECCIFKIPTVTLRDVTERPETIECGSNILSGSHPDDILRCVDIAIQSNHEWTPPYEYTMDDVSDTVLKILFGHLEKKI